MKKLLKNRIILPTLILALGSNLAFADSDKIAQQSGPIPSDSGDPGKSEDKTGSTSGGSGGGGSFPGGVSSRADTVGTGSAGSPSGSSTGRESTDDSSTSAPASQLWLSDAAIFLMNAITTAQGITNESTLEVQNANVIGNQAQFLMNAITRTIVDLQGLSQSVSSSNPEVVSQIQAVVVELVAAQGHARNVVASTQQGRMSQDYRTTIESALQNLNSAKQQLAAVGQALGVEELVNIGGPSGAPGSAGPTAGPTAPGGTQPGAPSADTGGGAGPASGPTAPSGPGPATGPTAPSGTQPGAPSADTTGSAGPATPGVDPNAPGGTPRAPGGTPNAPQGTGPAGGGSTQPY